MFGRISKPRRGVSSIASSWPGRDGAYLDVESNTQGEESDRANAAPGSARALAITWRRMVGDVDERLTRSSPGRLLGELPKHWTPRQPAGE